MEQHPTVVTTEKSHESSVDKKYWGEWIMRMKNKNEPKRKINGSLHANLMFFFFLIACYYLFISRVFLMVLVLFRYTLFLPSLSPPRSRFTEHFFVCSLSIWVAQILAHRCVNTIPEAINIICCPRFFLCLHEFLLAHTSGGQNSSQSIRFLRSEKAYDAKKGKKIIILLSFLNRFWRSHICVTAQRFPLEKGALPFLFYLYFVILVHCYLVNAIWPNCLM